MTTNWLNDVFGDDILVNGAPQTPRRGRINLISGAGVSISALDNPTLSETDITILQTAPATGGIDYKDSCKAATTGNITLSGPQTIDGVSVIQGDRVLVVAQTDATQNGIFTVQSAGWSRSSDANSSALVTGGLTVYVVSGTVNGGYTFKLTTPDPIVLGTTALTFTRQPLNISDVVAFGSAIGDTQYIQLGTTNPASVGQLRLANGGKIRWRNSTNTGDTGISLNTSNTLEVGVGGAQPTVTQVNALTSVDITVGGSRVMTVFESPANCPAFYFDANYKGGTGTVASIAVVPPTGARAGSALVIAGCGGGTGGGAQAAGEIVLLQGTPVSGGAAAGISFWDTSLATMARVINDGVTPRVEIDVVNLQFGAAVVAPKIWQADQTAASTNGQPLTAQAQNATGATSIGGQFNIKSGTGTTRAGNVVMSLGGTAALTLDAASSLIDMALPILRFTTGAASPSIYQADLATNGAAGQKLTIHAQNEIGTTSTGGALDVGPGSGTTAGGLGRLISGSAAARVQWNDTGIGFYTTAPVAQQTLATGLSFKGISNAIASLLTTYGLSTSAGSVTLDDPFQTVSSPTSTGSITSNTVETIGTLGGAITRTLPASPATGDWYYINSGPSASVSNVTVARNGKTINGAAADTVLNTNYATRRFIYNGTEWRTLNT